MREDPVRQDDPRDDDVDSARQLYTTMTVPALVVLRHAFAHVRDRHDASPRGVAFANGRLAAIDDELTRRALAPAGRTT
jgi:hypothetical protein